MWPGRFRSLIQWASWGGGIQWRVLNSGQWVVERRLDGERVWKPAVSPTGDEFFPAATDFDNDLFELVNGNELQFLTAPDCNNPIDANGDNLYQVRAKVTITGPTSTSAQRMAPAAAAWRGRRHAVGHTCESVPPHADWRFWARDRSGR